jgi:hypothetical protein
MTWFHIWSYLEDIFVVYNNLYSNFFEKFSNIIEFQLIFLQYLVFFILDLYYQILM